MGNIGVKTYFGRDTGTADAMVVTTSPPVPALADNVDVEFVKTATASNTTTTPTLAVSGLDGAAPIVRLDGTAVAAK